MKVMNVLLTHAPDGCMTHCRLICIRKQSTGM